MRPIVRALIAAVAVLIAGGAVRIYFYTSPPPTASFGSTSETNTSAGLSSQPMFAPCGYQESSGQPQGCWADYLGFIPAGYVLAPHYPNGAVYPCPAGMLASQCRQFQASCGNGVCDPNESCSTCAIDCSGPGPGQICNSYTGRVGSTTAVCQIAGPN
jgi:hypothetical protein